MGGGRGGRRKCEWVDEDDEAAGSKETLVRQKAARWIRLGECHTASVPDR